LYLWLLVYVIGPNVMHNLCLAKFDGKKGIDHAYPGVAPPTADEKDKVQFCTVQCSTAQHRAESKLSVPRQYITIKYGRSADRTYQNLRMVEELKFYAQYR
jgi:hypothetical protein